MMSAPLQDRPNILMIVADQQRWDAVGAAGRFAIRTPNLDALAAGGAFFEQATTPIPVCGPARQAMLSGLAPDSYGGLWNLDFLDCPALQPSERFATAALQRAGYACSLIGKWNVSKTHSPADFGFEHHDDLKQDFAEAAARYPGLAWPNGWFGDPSPVALGDSRTHLAAHAVCRRMDHCQADGRPWLIRVDFQDPHLPCRPSEPFASLFRPEDVEPWDSCGDTLAGKPYIQRQQRVNWQLEGRNWPEWARTVALYYGMVAQIDDAVGQMLRHLGERGLTQNTVVIYTSDHGDLCGGHGMLDKHYVLYDDVIRVPLIIRYPALIPSGLRVGDFVSHLDLGATLADLCGLEAVDPGHGQSLLPLLRGQRQSGRDSAVCSANGQQFGLYAQRCLRTADWLYVWNLTDVDELYHVASDPGQLTNRIREPELQKTVAGLRRRLYETLDARRDPFVRAGWLRDQLLAGRKLDSL
ncbi:MAG: sulfatase-like hydrolase/transferase [Clostridiaceae bacterium]|nr:sulfatase-like hydrolase/transferase [Clostridiaceae bacterium]